jgi:hypothetical protein
MSDYKIQLERLERHYQSSINSYDVISFYDLAANLRFWTELKGNIEQKCNEKIFTISTFTNNLKKIFRGTEYVFCCLPNGVSTSAVATGENNGRLAVEGPIIGKFTQAVNFKVEKNGDLTINQFIMLYKDSSSNEVNVLKNETKRIPTEIVTFSKYLESSAIYFRFPGLEPKNISNNELIHRVANEYEGTHPSPKDTKFKVNNIFSKPVNRLMQYRCAELPLPYFVLLHIAKNIIDNFENKF